MPTGRLKLNTGGPTAYISPYTVDSGVVPVVIQDAVMDAAYHALEDAVAVEDSPVQHIRPDAEFGTASWGEEPGKGMASSLEVEIDPVDSSWFRSEPFGYPHR